MKRRPARRKPETNNFTMGSCDGKCWTRAGLRCEAVSGPVRFGRPEPRSFNLIATFYEYAEKPPIEVVANESNPCSDAESRKYEQSFRAPTAVQGTRPGTGSTKQNQSSLLNFSPSGYRKGCASLPSATNWATRAKSWVKMRSSVMGGDTARIAACACCPRLLGLSGARKSRAWAAASASMASTLRVFVDDALGA